MDFERFQEFMLQSAARHDADIAELRDQQKVLNESLRALSNTVDVLVNNQIHLQDSLDQLSESVVKLATETNNGFKEVKVELQELARIVFGHVTDPNGHSRAN